MRLFRRNSSIAVQSKYPLSSSTMYDAIIMGVRTFGIAGADEGFGKPGGGCGGGFGTGRKEATEP